MILLKQGGFAELQGGDFGSSFLSGFTGSIAGSMITAKSGDESFFGAKNKGGKYLARRTVAAAVVGGTTSEIAGGKFANGAATAAMVHLLNHENGHITQSKRLKANRLKAQGKLRQFTLDQAQLVEDGLISSNEAGARIYEQAGKLYNHPRLRNAMVSDLASILSDVPAGSITIGHGSNLYVGFGAFGGDGFGTLSDRSNQVRHFTAGFNFGYKQPALSRLINWLRPDDAIDEALNLESTRIGRGLRNGSISVDDLGNEIRRLGR